MEGILNDINGAVQSGDTDRTKELVQEAMDKGTPVMDILEKGLRAAMQVVGEKFETLEIFLPEVMLAADAMQAGVDILRPHLSSGGEGSKRETVMLGTVEGDVHDIGKNIVKIMLEGNGYNVADLGFNVPTLSFVERVQQEEPQVIGMSALMTSTMIHMPRIIKYLEDRGIRDKVRVLVGGAPVLPDWADEIGADGYGETAADAVKLVKDVFK